MERCCSFFKRTETWSQEHVPLGVRPAGNHDTSMQALEVHYSVLVYTIFRFCWEDRTNSLEWSFSVRTQRKIRLAGCRCLIMSPISSLVATPDSLLAVRNSVRIAEAPSKEFGWHGSWIMRPSRCYRRHFCIFSGIFTTEKVNIFCWQQYAPKNVWKWR